MKAHMAIDEFAVVGNEFDLVPGGDVIETLEFSLAFVVVDGMLLSAIGVIGPVLPYRLFKGIFYKNDIPFRLREGGGTYQ